MTREHGARKGTASTRQGWLLSDEVLLEHAKLCVLFSYNTTMQEITPGVWWLPLVPPYSINAFFADGMLFDAGTRFHPSLVRWMLRRHRVVAHALTHAHPDHQGGSHAICAALNIPLWCGAKDAPAVESGTTRELLPPTLSNRLVDGAFRGPPHPVACVLREGDTVGDFDVLDVPGHSSGHIAFWRQRDRVLIMGDVVVHCHPLTNRIELREPLARFTPNPSLNRRSARKLAALHPRVLCFGHGPPLNNNGQFEAFVDTLDS
jgi:glyoxylase-like metal-dependent hydrolase (beta-lactamase superfamily II)